jgi:transcriptional regulator with XRE-family HTH domain
MRDVCAARPLSVAPPAQPARVTSGHWPEKPKLWRAPTRPAASRRSISWDKNCSAAPGGGTVVLAIIKQADAMTTRSGRPVDVLVGQNIRICRMQRGLSQSELATRVGLTFQQIQKYEKAANRVGASRLIQVADALGVPLATLFEGSATAARGEPDLSGRALLANPHALRLVQAFDRIADHKHRTAVLQLVESIGKASERHRSAR